ncbi:nitrate- and nitrite sensing domain-containing protein [Actinomadura sp. NPDC047616]|uniref:sensor histidine kinase n=1 Tax=Actinomadura sp. NPDC047616 TaxID=3155914 RepID=UPI0033C7E43D
MRFRNSRLRTKIAALLASLFALWAFAAWVTLREGLGLLWSNTLDSKVSRPTVSLVTALQEERRASLVYLGDPGAQERQELNAKRGRTDVAVRKLRASIRGGDVARAANDSLEERLREMDRTLNGLDGGRTSLDAGRGTRVQTATFYDDVIDSAFRVFSSTGAVLNNEEISKDSRTLNALVRAKEMLAREDALLAGAIAARRFDPGERERFIRLVGTQRFMYEEAAAELPEADRARYDRMNAGATFTRLRALEERTMQRATVRPPVSASEWEGTTQPALADVEKLVLTGGDDLLKRAEPVGFQIILRLVLAGGLGLLAVIASIVVSITTARALVRQLEKLRGAAWELAQERLPGVVLRLEHGEKVDVAAEAPPLEFGTDEIGQVGRAFNAVRETAIRTAVEQAELRRGIRDVLLSLARRTQTLVQRQLSLLDQMERRRDIDPKELQELFRLDHLATRMRRNAENLIVLSGSIPARGWRRSVPMVDVVRAAVGEVEDYTRVQVLPFGPVELAGRAVGDITHLLAELIENAVSFSPPDTVVQVGGHMVASGFAIDIEDRGLGMTDEKLAEINERIADPPEFNMQSSVQLGLFVVGKLAERYGVQVSLKRSAYGGTTAVVVVPRELVVEPSDRRGATGPQPVTDGQTTENGLAVRPPAAVGAAPVGPGEPGQGQRSLVAVPSPAPERPADRSNGRRAAPSTGRGGDGGRAAGDDEGDDAPATARTGPGRGAANGAARPDDDPTPPEDQPTVPENPSTPSGLPVRVPQANLAPPLREDAPAEDEQQDEEPDEPGRSPEEVLRIMGSYQKGTRRGRDEAARAMGTRAAEGEDDQ